MSSLEKAIGRFDIIVKTGKLTNSIGMIGLFCMMVATCVDVFSRYVFNHSFTGIYEYTEATLVILVYFSLAYALSERSLVCCDIVVQHLNEKGKATINVSNTIICIIVSAVMVWRAASLFIYHINYNESTNSGLYIPAAIFSGCMIFGCLIFALLFIRQLLQDIAAGIETKLCVRHWIVAVVIPAIIVAVSMIIMFQKNSWNSTTIGIIGIIFSLVFMFMGMPIGIAFVLCGVIFVAVIKNFNVSMNMLSSAMFQQCCSYSWTVIPFFVFMGYLVFYSDFGKDLYTMAYAWVGRLHGGLAIATVTSCALFAAIVGTGTGPIVTMGAVALPEMRRYHYSEELSTGSIVAGGSLGPIIPPSQPLIIYALLSQQSVGKLFMATLIPGIMLWLAFSLYIYIYCKIKPAAGAAATEKYSIREKLRMSKNGIPVVILFVAVMGSIYLGICSATEAGAVGCGICLLMAVCMRRMNFKKLKKALVDSGKATAMTFLILIGASMLGNIITVARIPQFLTKLIQQMAANPTLTLITILFIFFFLGFFIEIMPLLLIGVPVVHPALVAMGFDPIWVTIILATTLGLGAITPPVGINLFTLKAVSKETPLKTIYKGILPFVFVSVAVIILCYVCPFFVTWLPGIMK